jgi:hypothetical protein
MKKGKRKKSLVGWTNKNWSLHFAFSDPYGYFYVSHPHIMRTKKEAGNIAKCSKTFQYAQVRITIEELH